MDHSLRIREDVPKYCLNRDNNSSYFARKGLEKEE